MRVVSSMSEKNARIAALPTAQNVYTFSSRFGRGTVQARDSAVVTTLACVPVVLVIAVLLG